jgi:hypothetical protein
MRCGLLILLLLTPWPLWAKNRKLEGFVLNPAAFRKIHSFCVDTHNLPPDQVRVIDRFVFQESKPEGLLTRLPWHRRATCQDADLDAIVRLEFPLDPPVFLRPDHVEGVLLLFRPGSPSPIYETPAVTVPGHPQRSDDDPFDVKLIAPLLEYDAAGSALRILIHDWHR